MAIKPTIFPDWATNNPSNVVAPSSAQVQQGFKPGDVLPAENYNWQISQIGQFLRYFDGAIAANTTLSTIDPNIRLLGGGQYSWVNSTNTLSWSEPLIFAYPGLPDSANSLAAGSLTIPSGSVAYVTTNNPIVVASDVTSGSATLSNVARPGDIQVGWQVSGTGIPSGATVKAIDASAQTVTLSSPATTTASQAPISYARVGALSAQVAPMASYAASPSNVIFARATDASCIVGVGTGQMHLGDTEQRRFLRQGFGATLNLTAGVALSQGQAVYVSSGSDGRTAGSAYPCDASAANGLTRGKFIGFVYGAAAAGGTARVVSSGIVPLTQTLVPGTSYYLDPANVGAISSVRPFVLSQYVVFVGTAISTNALMLPQVTPATPQTFENLCDKLDYEIGAARFETAYTANSDLGLYKAYPSSSGTLTGGFYRNFPGSPYVLEVNGMAPSLTIAGGLSFYLYYAYKTGTQVGPFPLGTGTTGVAASGSLNPTSYVNNVANYFLDLRSLNLRLDQNAALFAAVRSNASQSQNNGVVFHMRLAIPPA